MRMDKQGKGGSNAVDEGGKRKHERENKYPTTPLSPLHHNKRNNRQGNQGEYRG